jgi:hypothetical protein
VQGPRHLQRGPSDKDRTIDPTSHQPAQRSFAGR